MGEMDKQMGAGSDTPIEGQTYLPPNSLHPEATIKSPTSEFAVSFGEAHFGTDFFSENGMKFVGTFLSVTSISGNGEIVKVGKGQQHAQFNDPALVEQVKLALVDIVGKKTAMVSDEARMNYMIDDILDDHRLNGSAPQNPSVSRQTP